MARTCAAAEWLVGVEDSGEKSEGKGAHTEREVKGPGIAERLEALRGQREPGELPEALARKGPVRPDSPLCSPELVAGPGGGGAFST